MTTSKQHPKQNLQSHKAVELAFRNYLIRNGVNTEGLVRSSIKDDKSEEGKVCIIVLTDVNGAEASATYLVEKVDNSWKAEITDIPDISDRLERKLPIGLSVIVPIDEAQSLILAFSQNAGITLNTQDLINLLFINWKESSSRELHRSYLIGEIRALIDNKQGHKVEFDKGTVTIRTYYSTLTLVTWSDSTVKVSINLWKGSLLDIPFIVEWLDTRGRKWNAEIAYADMSPYEYNMDPYDRSRALALVHRSVTPRAQRPDYFFSRGEIKDKHLVDCLVMLRSKLAKARAEIQWLNPNPKRIESQIRRLLNLSDEVEIGLLDVDEMIIDLLICNETPIYTEASRQIAMELHIEEEGEED